MRLDMPSHTQLFREFPQALFGHLRGEMRLRIVQNEIVISIYKCEGTVPTQSVIYH